MATLYPKLKARTSRALGNAPPGSAAIERLAADAEAAQWSDAAVAAAAAARAQDVVRAAAETSYYGPMLAGLPPDADPVDAIRALPVLERRARRGRSSDFLVPAPIQVHAAVTSGTGGDPTQSAKPRTSLVRRGALERRWFTGLGLPEFFRVAKVRDGVGEGRRSTHFHDWRVSYREIGVADAERALRAGRTPGELILSTPRILGHLAALAGWSRTSALASSFELLEPEVAAVLEAQGPAFGEMYCAGEISVPMAFRFPGCAGLHVNADFVDLETVDGSGGSMRPGMAGRVLVTDLVNDLMPLLRYEIGDVGSLHPASACSCGRTLPLLRLYGRLARSVRVRGGGVADAERLLASLAPWLGERFVLRQLALDDYEVASAEECDLDRARAALCRTVGDARLRRRSLPTELEALASDGAVAITSSDRPSGWTPDRRTPLPRPHPRHQSMRLRPPSARPDSGAIDPTLRTRTALRRMVRDARAQRGREGRIRVLDSRSMAPLLRGGAEASIEWGGALDRDVVGRVLVLELDDGMLAMHRAIHERRQGATRWILQAADSYTIGDPYSASWVPAESVLGRVTALERDGGAVDLTTRRAVVGGRIVAWGGRVLYRADRAPGRAVVARLAIALQRALVYAAAAAIARPSGE
jgi:hypothetical protein